MTSASATVVWLADEDNSNIHKITYEGKSIGNTVADNTAAQTGLASKAIINAAANTYNVEVIVDNDLAKGCAAVDNLQGLRWTLTT